LKLLSSTGVSGIPKPSTLSWHAEHIQPGPVGINTKVSVHD
jgi:hypothetical protein